MGSGYQCNCHGGDYSFFSMQDLVLADLGLLRAVSTPHLSCIPLSFITVPGTGVPQEYCGHRQKLNAWKKYTTALLDQEGGFCAAVFPAALCSVIWVI